MEYPCDPADNNKDNNVMIHHYIASNIPRMDPPITTLSVYTNTPIVGVFINEADDVVDKYVHFLESIVRRFLRAEKIPYVSLCNEEDMGVFVEFRNMQNLVDFYKKLKTVKMTVPVVDDVQVIKLEVEVSYLPPPPPSSF